MTYVQPPTSVECKFSEAGESYLGTVASASSTNNCRYWTSNLTYSNQAFGANSVKKVKVTNFLRQIQNQLWYVSSQFFSILVSKLHTKELIRWQGSVVENRAAALCPCSSELCAELLWLLALPTKPYRQILPHISSEWSWSNYLKKRNYFSVESF